MIKVLTKDLKRALDNVKYATSKDLSRRVFTGIYLEIEDNRLTFTSSDLCRIFTISIPSEYIKTPNEIDNIKKCVIPVFSIPNNAHRYTFIKFIEGDIVFDFVNLRAKYKLIDGEFIHYREYIKIQPTLKIKFNVKFLQEALKGEKGEIELQFVDNKSPVLIIGQAQKYVLPLRYEEEN